MKSIYRLIVLLVVCIMCIGCGELDNMVGSVVPVEDGKDGTAGTNGSDGGNGTDGIDGIDGIDGTSSVVRLVDAVMVDCDTVNITVEKIGSNSSYIVTVDVYGTPEDGQSAPYISHNIDVDVNNEFILETVGYPPFYVVIDGTDGLYVTCII